MGISSVISDTRANQNMKTSLKAHIECTLEEAKQSVAKDCQLRDVHKQGGEERLSDIIVTITDLPQVQDKDDAERIKELERQLAIAKEACSKYHQILVMLNRDFDSHENTPNKMLQIERSSWSEAVSRGKSLEEILTQLNQKEGGE